MAIPPTPKPPPTIDVQVVAVALDADARPDIQARFRELAEHGDTARKDSLRAMLAGATSVLLAHEASFTHASCTQALGATNAIAQAFYRDAAATARSRFPVEVIRNAYGHTTRQAPPELAPSSEPGVVVVTLVVATRGRFVHVAAHPDRAALRAAIAQAGKTSAADLVSMEVIWSPAEENDRVDVATLEAKNPELGRLGA